MQAVCFDMDGVLVDSERYWVPLENDEILPRVAPGRGAEADEITGMNYREIYDYLDERYGTAVSREEFLELFDEAAREIFGERAALLPGLHDLLAELRGRGVGRAMVTSSPDHWIELVFDRFDLHATFDVDGPRSSAGEAASFDAVVSADGMDGPGKPEPHVYRLAAEVVGADPVDCVAVEDSAHGIESAHRAGMFVVGFRFGGEPGDGPADVLVETPGGLHEVLLEGTA